MQPQVDLGVCSSQLLIPYFIALKKFQSSSNQLEIILLNAFEPEATFIETLEKYNIKIIHRIDAVGRDYNALFLLPNNILFANSQAYLEGIRFQRVVFCADGFRNGLCFDPNLPLPTEVIFWGFKLREKSFFDSFEFDYLDKRCKVVPINYIVEAWKDVLEAVLRESNVNYGDVLGKDDVLVVLRHWGKYHYKFRPGVQIETLTEEYLGELKDKKRIIVKGHPLDLEAEESTCLHLRGVYGSKGLEVLKWSDCFLSDSPNAWLLCPESMILNNSFRKLGELVAFDSSTNVLAQIFLPEVSVAWPDRIDLSEVFLLGRNLAIVEEQISWMSSLSETSVPDLENSVVEIGGYSTYQMIIDVYLKQYFAELQRARVNLDALTQERDALTQERDALTQERDALTNSTIWGTNPFLKALVSKIKRN